MGIEIYNLLFQSPLKLKKKLHGQRDFILLCKVSVDQQLSPHEQLRILAIDG